MAQKKPKIKKKSIIRRQDVKMKGKTIGVMAVLLAVTLTLGCLNYGGQEPATTSNAGVAQFAGTGEVKEFDMTAVQWSFDPETITVNKGDTVKLHINSIDVAHGFRLPDFGVNERLELGKTVNVEFVADKTGTFMFSCSVVCGSGHSRMKGKLIVK